MLGARGLSVVLSFSQDERLSTKTCSGLTTFSKQEQSSRSRTAEANEARLVHSGNFQNCGFGWIRSLFSSWQVVLPMCWGSRPEWYFHHHGISCANVWGAVTPQLTLKKQMKKEASSSTAKSHCSLVFMPPSQCHLFPPILHAGC